MFDSNDKHDGPDQSDRRKIVIAILKWLSVHRIPRRVAAASINRGFQPERKRAKRPIGVKRVEQISELATALGFKSHNGLYPAPDKDKPPTGVEHDLRRLYDIDESDQSWSAYERWDLEAFVDGYIAEHKDTAVPRRGVPAPPGDFAGRVPTQIPSANPNLDSCRDGKAWSLIEGLCAIILFGNQDGRADLDFELSGQPTSVTIHDETDRRILLQRDVVVKRCIVELNLGGAEIHGGLTALKRTVAFFLARPDAHHLLIEVGGSARAPRLIVQVREGAIGVTRPLLGPPAAETGEAQSVCHLVEVKAGTKVTALVRIYGAELQDQEPPKDALGTANDDADEPALAQKKDRPLAADDRVRIMMHLWKIAKDAERNPDRREPGVLTLSYDARTFVERQHGTE